MPHADPDITGQRFGRLVAIRQVENTVPTKTNLKGFPRWECLCDCGNLTVGTRVQLRTGKKKSCGCLRKEIAAESLRKTATHHGVGKHILYGTWWQIVQRCTNISHKNYSQYGGRGITIHPAWMKPEVFIREIEASLGVRPEKCSLDRINNDGNYEPGNVRWATQSDQVRNGRWKDRFVATPEGYVRKLL